MTSLPAFDPRASAVEPKTPEPALPRQALSFESLSPILLQAQQQPGFPQWAPELLRDRRRPEQPIDPDKAVRASVLITLVGYDSPSVVMTIRTPHLSSHAGQISFPGGRAESHVPESATTALREAQEEIGLDRQGVQVVGQLPDYLTVTGFRVTPVIGWVKTTPTLRPDPREVDDIFIVPLDFLMNPANHQMRQVSADQSPTREAIRFYAMPYCCPEHGGREFFIWGATAAMIRNLYHFVYAGWTQTHLRP
jgi:8-oxo-dGTP pyrophosphatase MutT (NUDIX family)